MSKKDKKKPASKKTAAARELVIAADPYCDDFGLTFEQAAFVRAYCNPPHLYNGTRAYIAAYGLDPLNDELSAQTCASRLLRNVMVQQAIYREREKLVADHDRLAKRIMAEWEKAAFSDLTEAIEIVGPVVRWREEIPPHMRSLIKGVEQTANGIKVLFHNKEKAMENLGKALSMFVEVKKEVGENYESLLDRLAREEAESDDTENG